MLGKKKKQCPRVKYLLLLEVRPFLSVLDHETLGSLWVRHFCDTWAGGGIV